MAGVAPQQRGGSNATTIGMVIAIVVAVLLLGVLIWLFTMQEQLRTTADQATRTKNRLATSGDEAAGKQRFPDARGTLVGAMNEGFDLVCLRMTGNQNDSPADAVAQLDTVLDEIRQEKKVTDLEAVSSEYGTVTILKNMYDMFTAEQAAKEDAEAKLIQARDQLEALGETNKQLADDSKGQYDRLAAKVEELQKSKTELDDLKGGEIEALARQISDKQDQLDSMRRIRLELLKEFQTEIAQRDRAIGEQSRALAAYRGEGIPPSAEPLAMARKPIGEVLRALPGDSLVHIDLGRVDNVTLGMPFSVYSSGQRVPEDGHGKANLEVVSVGQRTAECRVTLPPTPDEPILPGDGVGNIVLSRNRAKKTTICFVGGFDVDFNGKDDPRGIEAYKALAERLGAEVVDAVDARTDYLVIGMEPRSAEASFAAGATDEDAAEDEYAEDEDEDSYDEDEDEYDDEDEYEDEDEDLDSDEDEDDADDDEGDDEYDDEDDADEATVTPSIKKEQEIDPTLAPRARRAKTERERYFEAVRRAELFAIPRLRQEPFLSFIGIEAGPDATKQLLQ